MAKSNLSERQKKILKTYEKECKEVEIGDIDGIDEKKDFSNQEFTIALAKLNPFYTKFFSFRCFTKPYVDKIIEAGKIFFTDRINDGHYRFKGSEVVDSSRYDEDWEFFCGMVKEKAFLRAAWLMDRKEIDKIYEAKDKYTR